MNTPHSHLTDDVTLCEINHFQRGQSWKKIGYRIRGCIANLLGHESGRRKLSYGTRIHLYNTIMNDLETLAHVKGYNTKCTQSILKSLERDRQRGENRKGVLARPYDKDPIMRLLQTTSRTSEIEYVLFFLERYIFLRREIVERIIIAPLAHSFLEY